MFMRKNLLSLILIVAFVLAACSGGAQPAEVMADTGKSGEIMEARPTGEMMPEKTGPEKTGPEKAGPEKTGEEMMDGKPAEEMMEDKPKEGMPSGDMKETPVPETGMSEEGMDEGMLERPAFFSAVLTNVATGETFTLQDLKGKVVLVENMAIWCSTCLRQQKQVKELHGLLEERDDFISLGLDIDPNEDPESLASYISSNGFDWTYAVASGEVARELGQLYGAQLLNPPSAPMFIIDRHGEVHVLPFGVKSASDLQAALEPFLKEGM